MGVRAWWLYLGERFEEGSMIKSKIRLLSVSALAGAGLLVSSPLVAQEFRLGDVDVRLSTTASVGLTVATADREEKFLPLVNGGPNGTFATVSQGGDAPGLGSLYVAADTGDCLHNLSNCQSATPTTETGGYAGSINTDDGRLNFDNGDLTSAVAKATVDIEANSGNLRAFARISAFYDAVLSSDSSYERKEMYESGENVAQNHLEVLDAYVDYEGSVMDLPFMVRVGKQVINWGESTFVLGGNSVFSPIDVAAIQRPGAEIKEALLPVEALYGSISLPYDLSVEAYVGGHDPFKLPAAGSFLSNVDGFFEGGIGGSFIGGSPDSGNGRLNCHRTAEQAQAAGYGNVAAGAYTQGLGAAYEAALAADGKSNCTSGDGQDFADFRYKLGSGSLTAEEERVAAADPYFLPRNKSRDDDPDFGDTYGLAVRWYAENLNSTEFGLYYQKYNSRIPYVSIWAPGLQPGVGAIGASSSAANRGSAMLAECGAWLIGAPVAPIASLGYPGGYSKGFAIADMISNTNVVDNFGILDDETDFGQVIDGLHGDGGSAAGWDEVGNGLIAAGYIDLATKTALEARDGVVGDGWTTPANTAARAMETSCYSFASASSTYAGQGLDTGEMVVGMGWGNSEYVAEYPEVEVMGISFATTAFGWGVQGEVAYRPDMPMQIDTDSVTISTLVANCGFGGYGGYATASAYQSFAEFNRHRDIGCGDTGLISGIEEADALNWDIGTTALFASSHPITRFFRANSAVFLTEFAGLIVDEIDDDNGRFEDGTGIVSVNNCTSGSDLALKGVFSLDPRDADECRGTKESSGAVLLGRLTYNNVFGTPWSLSPTLVISEGLSGRSPRPAGNWIEGVGRRGLSVSADYQDWTVGVSYTDYYGDIKFSRMVDKDNISISVVRGF